MFTLLFGDYTFPNQSFELQDSVIDNNIQEDSIPRKHGTIIQIPYLKSRAFKIRGFIHSSSVETSHTQLLAMQKALLAVESNFQYRSDRYIKCYTKKVQPDPKDGTDRAVLEINIQLVAQNPFFYSAGVSISDVQTPVKGTTLSFSINNQGDVFSEPIYKVCATGGTINDDVMVTNQTNGKVIRFRGIIANGVTLEINSEELTVMNNGVDGLSNYEGDFATLDAGTNTFQYVGATCRFTTEYKRGGINASMEDSMPLRDDFDKEAMERKIKKNLDKFTIEQILEALQVEKLDVLKSIQVKEARAAELEDQIIYIKEYHVKS